MLQDDCAAMAAAESMSQVLQHRCSGRAPPGIENTVSGSCRRAVMGSSNIQASVEVGLKENFGSHMAYKQGCPAQAMSCYDGADLR